MKKNIVNQYCPAMKALGKYFRVIYVKLDTLVSYVMNIVLVVCLEPIVAILVRTRIVEVLKDAIP